MKMHATSHTSFVALAATFLLVASNSLVEAHMKMASPLPRGNPSPAVGTPDYDLTSPLNGNDRPFPCGGKPAGDIVQTIQAGSTLSVKIDGGAPHDGGHCQFALSTDGGKQFVVVKDIIRTCIQNGPASIDVPIPASFPSGNAIFAWSWINAVGNREYYMNCADVKISGGGSGFTGPELFVANLPGKPTIPEINPESDNGFTSEAQKYFGQRKQITVGQAGGNSYQQTTDQPTATKTTESTPVAKAQSATTYTTAPAPPSSRPSQAKGSRCRGSSTSANDAVPTSSVTAEGIASPTDVAPVYSAASRRFSSSPLAAGLVRVLSVLKSW